MGESPFCATAHIETFGEARLTYGVMVACSDGEVVFNFIDNAVVVIWVSAGPGTFRVSL